MSKKFKFVPPSATTQEDDAPPKGKRWQVFGVLFLASILTILYVNNSIRINELLRDRDRLRHNLDSVQTSAHGIQMHIIRSQSAERIDSIARFSLRMTRNPNAPKLITISDKK